MYTCAENTVFKKYNFLNVEEFLVDSSLIKESIATSLWNVSGFSAEPATVFPAVRVPADENLVLFRRGVHDCRVRAEGAVLKPL